MVLPVTCHGTGPYNRMVNPRQSRFTVPLGGVDRDVGVFRTERGDTRDMLNVLLRDGTTHLRPGFSETAVIWPTAVDVLAMVYLSSEIVLLTVVIDATGMVKIYKVPTLGGTPVFVADWFQWDLVNRDMPVITMAQSYQMIFMAHDEERVDVGDPYLRAPTFVYDGITGLATALTAEWAKGAGSDDQIRFRGVVAYLDYVVGWGFGTNSEERAEMVRISLPGQPRVFDQNHWLVVGARGEPVTACAPAGNGLLVFKGVEAYPLLGTSPQTFGIGPAVDLKFGCVGVNLWVNINGILYFWSAEGPRLTTGGPSDDLAIPLDLDCPNPRSDGTTPNTLSNDAMRRGFATYVPDKRVILFVFDDWAYALDLRGGKPGGWSYWSLGGAVASAGIWYTPTLAPVTPGSVPVGPLFYPGWFIGATASTATLEVHNPSFAEDGWSITGNEFIEAYYRLTNSPEDEWLHISAGKTNGPGTINRFTLRNLEPDISYNVAVRYVLFGQHNPDYSADNPMFWDGRSVRGFSTGVNQDLVLRWYRVDLTTERVRVMWHESEAEPEGTLRYLEYFVGSGTPAWTIQEFAIPKGGQEIDPETDLPYWDYTVKTVENQNEQYMQFRVRITTDSTGPSAITWTGPDATAWMERVPPSWNLEATFSAPPAVGRPYLMFSDPVIYRGENYHPYRWDYECNAYTYVTDPDPDGPMGGWFQWEKRTQDTDELVDEREEYYFGPSHLEYHGLIGLVISNLVGTMEEGEPPSGWIQPNFNYRVRCRAAQVWPEPNTVYDYMEDPTGMIMDYSEWSQWSPLKTT